MKERTIIASIPFDDLSEEELAARCFAVRRAKGCCALFTPNAVMLAAAAEEEALRALLSSSDVSAVDGDGVRLAAARQGIVLRHGKQAGVELGRRLLYEAAARGERVFLYGGMPGVAEAAARRLAEDCPDLRIAGVCHGYRSEKDALRRIRESHATVILVCLGFPKQEEFIAAHKEELGGILAGLGGSLDVYAGRVRRAPLLFRSLRLEWLWRCLREPRRLRGVLMAARWLLSKERNTVGLRVKSPDTVDRIKEL